MGKMGSGYNTYPPPPTPASKTNIIYKRGVHIILFWQFTKYIIIAYMIGWKLQRLRIERPKKKYCIWHADKARNEMFLNLFFYREKFETEMVQKEKEVERNITQGYLIIFVSFFPFNHTFQRILYHTHILFCRIRQSYHTKKERQLWVVFRVLSERPEKLRLLHSASLH